jgi:hypothetical protein
MPPYPERDWRASTFMRGAGLRLVFCYEKINLYPRKIC